MNNNNNPKSNSPATSPSLQPTPDSLASYLLELEDELTVRTRALTMITSMNDAALLSTHPSSSTNNNNSQHLTKSKQLISSYNKHRREYHLKDKGPNLYASKFLKNVSDSQFDLTNIYKRNDNFDSYQQSPDLDRIIYPTFGKCSLDFSFYCSRQISNHQPTRSSSASGTVLTHHLKTFLLKILE